MNVPAGLNSPLDAIAAAVTTAWCRVCLFALAIPLGLITGSLCADGVSFAWSSALFPLFWAGVAWIAFPSYLVVNIITLAMLVATLASESRIATLASLTILVGAWAWLAYIWA